MNRLTASIITLLLLVGSQACVEDKIIVQEDIFFSLDDFMNEQKEQLIKYDRIMKTVSLQGKTDSSEVELEQAKQELEIFANADINKASWLDKYRVDSIFINGSNLDQLLYTSLDSSLNTRTLRIDFENGQVSHIWIKRKKATLISSKKETMEYWPDKGYVINNQQKLILSNDQKLDVEVRFIKKK